MEIRTDKPYRIFAEALEQGAIDQFESAMQQPFVVKGALMPDAHQGYSLPIGAVVATDGVVLPAWVGYDIGCGMCALKTSAPSAAVRENAKAIFDEIYRTIPVGFSHHQRDGQWELGREISRTDRMEEIFSKDGLRQVGTLGGGNHFIEVGESDSGETWIIVHSGSRGIGHATATHYMRLASGDGKAREGHFGFEDSSPLGRDYIKDMHFCLEFALENRRQVISRAEAAVSKYCGGIGHWAGLVNRNHNHAEMKDGLWIHRKGATHAEAGMRGVIPGNMRDGSFLVTGKGNPEALYSSSHGAGRVLGRKEAKRTLALGDFQEAMSGVVALVTDETLDESPFAYKNIYDVMAQQEDMIEVTAHVKPILNIKG